MHELRLSLPAGARLPLHPQELRALVLGMLRLLAPHASVDLLLTRDGEIARLNARYLNCPGPTNCLAFPENSPAEALSGGLALSLDALQRECLLYGQKPELHLRRLLAHGLAHLAGYDHGPEMDAVCAELEKAGEEN